MKLDTTFDNIEYLRYGTKKQINAYNTLTNHSILKLLHQYDPLLVGTVPINIDIKKSDLDIICFVEDITHFSTVVVDYFGDLPYFKIWENSNLVPHAVIARFEIDNFEIEIFGQNIPTKKQNAYRHMIIQNRIIAEKGETFRRKIVSLKQNGYKTEPAFAIELGLKGDPYLALLEYEEKE